jgi:hypothetical protein
MKKYRLECRALPWTCRDCDCLRTGLEKSTTPRTERDSFSWPACRRARVFAGPRNGFHGRLVHQKSAAGVFSEITPSITPVSHFSSRWSGPHAILEGMKMTEIGLPVGFYQNQSMPFHNFCFLFPFIVGYTFLCFFFFFCILLCSLELSAKVGEPSISPLLFRQILPYNILVQNFLI